MPPPRRGSRGSPRSGSVWSRRRPTRRTYFTLPALARRAREPPRQPADQALPRGADAAPSPGCCCARPGSRACGPSRCRALGTDPASRVGHAPGRPRDDLRPRRRRARARRARDDGLREPDADRESAPRPRSRSSARSGSTRTGSIPTLADRSHGFVYVDRQADPAQAAALQRLKLPGFGFYPEERRTYPQGSVAAQVLGYVGVDGNGLSGLELQFDKSLAGRAGKETIVKDPGGRVIDVAARAAGDPGSRRLPHARPQRSRRTRRRCCARPFASGTRRARARIVLDPRTGAILAMAVQPGLRREPLSRPRRATCSATEPSPTRTSRARRSSSITVAGALSERARLAVDAVHAAVLACTSPTASSTTPRSAAR